MILETIVLTGKEKTLSELLTSVQNGNYDFILDNYEFLYMTTDSGVIKVHRDKTYDKNVTVDLSDYAKFSDFNPESWKDVQNIVRAGLAPYVFSIGDQFVVTRNDKELTFDVIGIDHDTPADPKYTHSMTLQMHDLWTSVMQYDASEAMYYIDEATHPNGLPAGIYNFTWNYATGSMVNGTYQFTLSKPIPVGGQIVIGTNSSSTAITRCKISTYATPGATTKIEGDIVITTGTEGVSLGTISATSSTSTNLNCAQRIMGGSDNWSASAIRQWLNSDKAGGEWWEAKNVFDRPSANTGANGFLKGFDPAFLDVVGEVTKKTQLSSSDNYGMATSAERFFLLSRPEIYAGTERSADGADGTVYPYYGDGYSDLTAPGIGTDSNRIKYRNGSATYWWLRTPSYPDGHVVRLVHRVGSLHIIAAYDNYGVAPACVIV